MSATVLLMPLLNEGTAVWRPVEVKPLDDGTYEIVGHMADGEQWAFAPGSIVASRPGRFDGEEHPIAVALTRPIHDSSNGAS